MIFRLKKLGVDRWAYLPCLSMAGTIIIETSHCGDVRLSLPEGSWMLIETFNSAKNTWELKVSRTNS